MRSDRLGKILKSEFKLKEIKNLIGKMTEVQFQIKLIKSRWFWRWKACWLCSDGDIKKRLQHLGSQYILIIDFSLTKKVCFVLFKTQDMKKPTSKIILYNSDYILKTFSDDI